MTLQRALLLALMLLAAPMQVSGQTVSIQGRGDPELDNHIRRFLADPDVVVLTQDTLIARADTLRGRIAAIGIVVRVAGVVDADLLIIDSNVFVRPHGVVRGTVTNIGGGFFPSSLARVEAELTEHGDAPYDVEHRADGVHIIGLTRRRDFDPGRFWGLRLPTYDRAAGLTLSAGATWYPVPPARVEPRIQGWGGYAFEREDFVGGASIRLTGFDMGFEVGAERVTATQDQWIRGDVLNSLGVLAKGSDYRDYYAAERVWASLTRFAGDVTIQLQAGIEDATSLAARDVWSIVEPDSIRPNAAVAEGRIASATLGADASIGSDWIQMRLSLSGESGWEVAGGDFDFRRYLAEAQIAASGLSNHTLEVTGRLQGPLPGTDSLPQQRRSLLGGLGTVETLPIGALRGDRLALLRTTYAVPLDPLRIPFLGSPVAEAVHAIGSAWTHGSAADFVQALGVRIHFPLLYVFAFVDPAGERDPSFGVAARFRPHFPWEEPIR
jgi:hypothetical protein